ncbi:MAG: tyrosine--tRNA ligase, partial [Planctomycetota bacterium]
MTPSTNATSDQRIDFLAELRWRNLFHQATHEDALAKHLSEPDSAPRRAYAGFDPTADSLTIGNLIPIMVLIHFARAGHTPVVIMGGGTGLIGDPSGKSAERQLLTPERVQEHIDSQREIFQRAFAGAGLPEPTIYNNYDWLKDLSYLEALRDVGKHFSVNMMVQKDSVRDRLNKRDQGISYTEFSYMILQAYDFLHLHRDSNVTIQLGGSDQYGNIVAGCDLIRRVIAADADDPEGVSADAFGMTAPLVTKADGGKFGKTESGAVWLSAHRTSPYAYYQFWLNAADEDVGRFLRLFTLMTKDEIE